MTHKAKELLQEALSLSEQERADLASSLIDSLDSSSDPGAEDAWNREIADRITDLDSGKAKTGFWKQIRRISSKHA